MKFPLALNILYCCQTIKLAVGAVVESLYALINEEVSVIILLLSCI